MPALASRRFLLPALLAAATLLFAVGVIAERSAADVHAKPTAEVADSADTGEAGHVEGGGEEGATTPAAEGVEAAHAAGEGVTAGEPAGSAESHSQPEQLLGVNIESTPFIVLAVLAGLALSAAATSDLRRRGAFLVAVAVIALAWAALDVRELVHQLDESREGIAVVAAAVALVHLLAAAVAGRGASRIPQAPA